MNDEYDNARTDRAMLGKLARDGGATALPGDGTITFAFPSVDQAGVNHLVSLAQATAELLRKRGHNGPFSVTVTVACQNDVHAENPDCVPQLWDDGDPL